MFKKTFFLYSHPHADARCYLHVFAQPLIQSADKAATAV